MRTIWKFTLALGEWVETVTGADADGVTQVVLTGRDPATGSPAVWIAHDPKGTPTKRSFIVIGTGHPIPEGDAIEPIEHVGSYIDGPFVWHIYERTHYHGE